VVHMYICMHARRTYTQNLSLALPWIFLNIHGSPVAMAYYLNAGHEPRQLTLLIAQALDTAAEERQRIRLLRNRGEFKEAIAC